MAKSNHIYFRRAHHYLGVLPGIQFLLWTISRLYFSWTNIDKIHGDFEHRQPPQSAASFNLISPSAIIYQLPGIVDSINQVQLISILQKPFYIIRYYVGNTFQTIIADAQTGTIRQPVKKDEALTIAAESFVDIPTVQSIDYITSLNKHDQYREKPLPAWKIFFQNRANTHVCVPSLTGKVETLGNNKWRTFDLMWMFQTMDFNGRENINNKVLRVFSIFSIVTVLNGFTLIFFKF